MKNILIIHSNMEIGGAETSLLGLLQSIDYSKYEVSLMLYENKGELLRQIPSEVKIIDAGKYSVLTLPIVEVLLKRHSVRATFSRLSARRKGAEYKDAAYMTKQYSHKSAMKFLPQIPGKYDLAVSFIDPHYVLLNTDSKVKLGWLHTDFSRIEVPDKQDSDMWNICDYVVSVSDSCKEAFERKHPELAKKSIVIENILSKSFIESQAEQFSVTDFTAPINLLSIGRFSSQKNFDNVPDICKKIRQAGLDVKWYLIGYGGEEALIKSKISEAGMEDYVIILGKKTNPYPYIKACDLYVQPSRYEGKAVTVREAQILHKPVVITNYATSASQLEDGVDGVVVPMDNAACARGIVNLLQNPAKMREIAENTKTRDYTNAGEVEKIYKLMVK